MEKKAPDIPTDRETRSAGRLLVVMPILAAILSLTGLLAFILLFIPRMTVYWFILSPLIIIVYQFPAFVVMRMWKRKKARLEPEEGEEEEATKDAEGTEAPPPSPGEGTGGSGETPPPTQG